MRTSLIALSIAVGLALPAMASAHRPATRAEKIAMVYHAGNHYVPGVPVDEPRAAPLRCFEADIATVVRGSQWGAWTISVFRDSALNWTCSAPCPAFAVANEGASDPNHIILDANGQRSGTTGVAAGTYHQVQVVAEGTGRLSNSEASLIGISVSGGP